ncbi:hypothetical protein MKW98_021218 [Papaver atlanticum]|uniref:Uncharacterized protein n=1 Tax=Papaver atlanticum TaxID=357466 RepID=A0AAD4SA16_9MAGN|nr:hypothetical protein MKW98_021218 [Papaver atlanticum]
MDTKNEKTLVEILKEKIQVGIAEYINFVSNPQSGTIGTFSGTTRDTLEGKTVIVLELDSIAVFHHLGSVPAGYTRIFVVISYVHRDDVLDACKHVIDELKAYVPIFKKDVYSNGKIKVKEVPAAKERKSCCGHKTMVRDEKAECTS